MNRSQEAKEEAADSEPVLSILCNFYDQHLFLVEDLLLADMDCLELSIFTSATLCSVIYPYPSFQIQDHDTQTALVEYYHATSDPRYKLFQLLITGLKRKGTDIYWLQAPIFFGQL